MAFVLIGIAAAVAIGAAVIHLVRFYRAVGETLRREQELAKEIAAPIPTNKRPFLVKSKKKAKARAAAAR